NDVIVMNLDYVGEQSGLDYGLLSTIQKQSIRSRIIAAGGVRNQQDLIDLEQQGISRVLVASALHSGMLNVELVKQRQTVK
ncbi:MAG: HisA/HisF-related TIM barrel protein, partial [Gammaproteobacteria bacterium]|nr:HisA/HisF-related TIM barrel protein [Gammaproteobacteria bacterium]